MHFQHSIAKVVNFIIFLFQIALEVPKKIIGILIPRRNENEVLDDSGLQNENYLTSEEDEVLDNSGLHSENYLTDEEDEVLDNSELHNENDLAGEENEVLDNSELHNENDLAGEDVEVLDNSGLHNENDLAGEEVEVLDNSGLHNENDLAGEEVEVLDNSETHNENDVTGEEDEVLDNLGLDNENDVTGEENEVLDNSALRNENDLTGGENEVLDNLALHIESDLTGEEDEFLDNSGMHTMFNGHRHSNMHQRNQYTPRFQESLGERNELEFTPLLNKSRSRSRSVEIEQVNTNVEQIDEIASSAHRIQNLVLNNSQKTKDTNPSESLNRLPDADDPEISKAETIEDPFRTRFFITDFTKPNTLAKNLSRSISNLEISKPTSSVQSTSPVSPLPSTSKVCRTEITDSQLLKEAKTDQYEPAPKRLKSCIVSPVRRKRFDNEAPTCNHKGPPCKKVRFSFPESPPAPETLCRSDLDDEFSFPSEPKEKAITEDANNNVEVVEIEDERYPTAPRDSRKNGIIRHVIITNFMDIKDCSIGTTNSGHTILKNSTSFIIAVLLGIAYDHLTKSKESICGISFFDIQYQIRKQQSKISIRISVGTTRDSNLYKLFGKEFTITRKLSGDIHKSEFDIQAYDGSIREKVDPATIIKLLHEVGIHSEMAGLYVLDETNVISIIESPSLGYEYFEMILAERKRQAYLHFLDGYKLPTPDWINEPPEQWLVNEKDFENSELAALFKTTERELISDMILSYKDFFSTQMYLARDELAKVPSDAEPRGRDGTLKFDTEKKRIYLCVHCQDSHFASEFALSFKHVNNIWTKSNSEIKLLAGMGLFLSFWSVMNDSNFFVLFSPDNFRDSEFPLANKASNFLKKLVDEKSRFAVNNQQFLLPYETL